MPVTLTKKNRREDADVGTAEVIEPPTDEVVYMASVLVRVSQFAAAGKKGGNRCGESMSREGEGRRKRALARDVLVVTRWGPQGGAVQ